MNTTPKEEWAQTVDSWRMFPENDDSDLIDYDRIGTDTIKAFIRTTLAAQRKADFEAIEAKIHEEIEKWEPAYDDMSMARIDGMTASLATVRSILLPNTEDHEA